ncbi:MAG: N-acetylmuramoyl-L-alanine amidase [Hydrogenibacillus sp.]|nr:N-acetylmuramoyl-L-alanine amidase [Hydrogenibacillus sp.]
MSKLVVIDPGHGGHDPGASGYGLLEKNSTLDLALQVGKVLQDRYVVRVEWTRTTDAFVSLTDRATLANRLKADYFISLHHNAYDGNARGFESYIFSGKVNPFTGNAQKLIHVEIMQALKPYGVVDRGTKRADFAVLRETVMPALLVEYLFIDNAQDNALLQNLSVRQAMVEATARGIARVLGLSEKPDRQKAQGPSQTADKIYRVQVGAFRDRRNAERLLKKLKSLGFKDAMITETLAPPSDENQTN